MNFSKCQIFDLLTLLGRGWLGVAARLVGDWLVGVHSDLLVYVLVDLCIGGLVV